MPTQTRLSSEEVAARGEAWYERLKPQIESENIRRYLIVDVDTGDYDIGDDYILPTERLLAKRLSRLTRVGLGNGTRRSRRFWIPASRSI